MAVLGTNLNSLASALGADVKAIRAAVGYYTIFADSSTTFPARTTVPAWWTGRVLYDSTEYLNHPDPTDRVTNDQHISRTT